MSQIRNDNLDFVSTRGSGSSSSFRLNIASGIFTKMMKPTFKKVYLWAGAYLVVWLSWAPAEELCRRNT